MITAGIASMPSRIKSLEVTINSILPQVDILYVYLNNYSHIPKYLKHPKIKVFRSQNDCDYGDSGKFFMASRSEGYYFSIDDDIIYHSNYVKTLISHLKAYDNKAIVGLHGITFTKNITSYYRSRTVIHYKRTYPKDIQVHILGTGVMAFHTSAIDLKMEDFRINNMADIWVGIKAQQQNVKMICIRRKNPLAIPQNLSFKDDIHHKKYRADSIQTRIVKTITWKL